MTTRQRKVIVFKCDTGVCKSMSYIDLQEHQESHVMIETMQKNMEIFTKKEIELAELVRAVKRQVGHPTDKHMKNIVSQ